MIRSKEHTSFWRSRLFVVIGGIALIFIVFSATRELYNNYLLRKEIKNLEDQATKLESRRLELLDVAQKIQTGEYLEEEARLKLGLQKPGEKVVVINNDKNVPEKERTESRTNPQLWWDYFTRYSK